MIEESALLIDIDHDDASYAWIETKRQSSCGSCEGKSACGTQVLSKIVGKRKTQVKILNTCQAKVGDTVIIGIDEKVILSGSFYLYFIPLLSMILFSFFATILANKLSLSTYFIDIYSLFFAILGFFIGGWITRNKISNNQNKTYQAVMLRVIKNNSSKKYIPLSPMINHA